MNHAIIVAGGKGLRMGTDLPKQFLPIGGRPILMHTLEVFERAIPGIHLVLVLPADQQDFWQELCARHSFTLPHSIASGGETRFHSVLNGLKATEQAVSSQLRVQDSSNMEKLRSNDEINVQHSSSDELIAIHDGVRPFVSVDVIRRCFKTAQATGTAVPVIPAVETIREIIGESSITRDRSRYRLVQTPQTFQLSLLQRAYKQPYRTTFTDDASVVEALGHPITLVEGNRENIKITTTFDLTVAEALQHRRF